MKLKMEIVILLQSSTVEKSKKTPFKSLNNLSAMEMLSSSTADFEPWTLNLEVELLTSEMPDSAASLTWPLNPGINSLMFCKSESNPLVAGWKIKLLEN